MRILPMNIVSSYFILASALCPFAASYFETSKRKEIWAVLSGIDCLLIAVLLQNK